MKARIPGSADNFMIIHGLREIQRRRGYLPKAELELLATRLNKPLHQVFEVASYYPSFRLDPPPPVEVRVCRDLSCHLRNASGLLSSLKANVEKAGVTSVEGVSCLGRCDSAPVVHIVGHDVSGGRQSSEFDLLLADEDIESLEAVVKAVAPGSPPNEHILEDLSHHREPATSERRKLQIDIYDKEGDVDGPVRRWEAVRRFESNGLSPKELIRELEKAELEGLGGAAARTFNKWESVGKQDSTPKYVVCNGDESEPGTFKDRELMLRVPHLVVEGMILALRYLRARDGYIYVRHEYHAQIAALRAAVIEAETDLGNDGTFGAILPFRIEVVESPGGYICGEQSALLEALEGHRAQPRLQNSPTAIQSIGFRNKPTILNNVETLAWVPAIAIKGGDWHARLGHEQAFVPGNDGREIPRQDRYQGLRYFSISGDVKRPGVYEVPIGTPLRVLIEGNDFAQGIRDGGELKAVAPSGPSGGFLPATMNRRDLRELLEAAIGEADVEIAKAQDELLKADDRARPRIERDLARLTRSLARLRRFVESEAVRGDGDFSVLDLELATSLFKAFGSMLGAGIVVYGSSGGDTDMNMVSHARNATEFFSRESCGKCVPCRLGSRQLAHLAWRLDEGLYSRGDWQAESAECLVEGLEQTMESASICGLGKVASRPLSSLLKYFPSDVRKRQT